jgi:N-acetylmuramoyl-L-alanine amidase
MRTWRMSLLTAVAAALCVPASAAAAFQHVVAPGESLSSVAAADGLSVSQLAAANGLSSESELIVGSLLAIPPQESAGLAAPAADSAAPSTAPSAPQASAAGGGYVVAPGDTLSAIAARYGVSVSALAADNGLDPAGLLLSGTALNVSGLGESAPASSQAASAPVTASDQTAGAQPTTETVSPQEVGSIAAANGVSPALAEAIGYQESGFNNDEVSSTGATGVMQIEPGTWNYIGQTLATPPPLSPDSAADNIRGGVLLLHSLLDQTGGDGALAAAGYYQGLQSVEQHGEFSDTQQYVNDVMALSQRFGGQ